MAYISLYRKYRPDTFDKVIGQEHIVTTLINQIKTNTIAHAYLLTGTRGTGKTSVARIFARAVNCLNPTNGSPCGECEACKLLSQSNNMDIIEIDAASNNTVDDARNIRDSVRYAPVNAKYKVYLIDEVHQLSIQAFNALLKTLEEPPSYVIFILATTEVHKIPATIMSRCLRLDFRLLSQEALAAHIAGIFDKEGIKYTTEGVNAIARAGEGSVRDALSVADMCASFAADIVDYNCVLEVLGANDPILISELANALLGSNIQLALERVEHCAALGKSMQLLARDITKYFRDLLIIKNDIDANNYLKLPYDLFEASCAIASKYDNVQLLRSLEILGGVEATMRYSMQPRIVLEAALLKCATLAGTEALDIQSRLIALENKLQNGFETAKTDYSLLKSTLTPVKPAESQLQTPDKAPERNQSAHSASIEINSQTNDSHSAILDSTPLLQEVVNPDDIATIEDINTNLQTADKSSINNIPKEVRDQIIKLRGGIVNRLRAKKHLMLCLAIGDKDTLVKADNGAITIAFNKESDYNMCLRPNMQETLNSVISEELGTDCKVSIVLYNSTKPNALNASQFAELFGADIINFKGNFRR